MTPYDNAGALWFLTSGAADRIHGKPARRCGVIPGGAHDPAFSLNRESFR